MENRSYDSILALSKDGELYAQYGDADCSGDAICYVEKEGLILQYSMSETKPSIVFVYDTISNSFHTVTNTHLHLELQSGVWDLSVEGDRWEGALHNGKPWGFGSCYDYEGNLVYQGCMIDGVRSLFGVVFFGDTQKTEYAGMLLTGKKWGKGVLYDRHQKVLHDGDWIDDRPIFPYDSYDSLVSASALHTRLRRARLKLNRCASLHLHDFSVLASIVWEEGSSNLLTTIHIDAMPCLRSIRFDDHACSSSIADSSLSIRNCPCLETLVFKPSSCCFFSSLEIANCPLVCRLAFEGNNFMRARCCSLRSMGRLKDLTFSECSFMSVMDFELYDLSQLRTVTMGWCAFRGLPEGVGGGILRLSYLPNLRVIHRTGCNFEFYHSAVIDSSVGWLDARVECPAFEKKEIEIGALVFKRASGGHYTLKYRKECPLYWSPC